MVNSWAVMNHKTQILSQYILYCFDIYLIVGGGGGSKGCGEERELKYGGNYLLRALTPENSELFLIQSRLEVYSLGKQFSSWTNKTQILFETQAMEMRGIYGFN